ncbi:MAG: helix-hairpin-helix domain-containing protein [Proteobacteria bacterium]|nr:helix-hairpin-helix domain-containing protein [Pseudomonadota bacterium]
MSKNFILRTAAILLISSGAAFAQGTAPAANPNAPKPPPAAPTAPAQPPKAATPAPAPAAQAPAAPKAATPAPAPAAQATLVNLNTAGADELDKLPQIGPARAKDIIEARTKSGKFKDWNDFVARNVVPKNAEEAIKGKVRF